MICKERITSYLSTLSFMKFHRIRNKRNLSRCVFIDPLSNAINGRNEAGLKFHLDEAQQFSEMYENS